MKAAPFAVTVTKLLFEKEYATEETAVVLAGDIEADVRVFVGGKDIRTVTRTRQSKVLLGGWIEDLEAVKDDLSKHPKIECELTTTVLGPAAIRFTRNK